jgi:2-iminobutanoate/2-iminopropanoate deaminase
MEVIKGNSPYLGPISVGVKKNNVLYTAVIPVYPDGNFETGDITKQAELTFKNLQNLLVDAGSSLKDVVQVIVYLVDIKDAPQMTEVWRRYFSDPYPNRATIGVNELTVSGMKIEIVVTAIINEADIRERSE